MKVHCFILTYVEYLILKDLLWTGSLFVTLHIILCKKVSLSQSSSQRSAALIISKRAVSQTTKVFLGLYLFIRHVSHKISSQSSAALSTTSRCLPRTKDGWFELIQIVSSLSDDGEPDTKLILSLSKNNNLICVAEDESVSPVRGEDFYEKTASFHTSYYTEKEHAELHRIMLCSSMKRYFV